MADAVFLLKIGDFALYYRYFGKQDGWRASIRQKLTKLNWHTAGRGTDQAACVSLGERLALYKLRACASYRRVVLPSPCNSGGVSIAASFLLVNYSIQQNKAAYIKIS